MAEQDPLKSKTTVRVYIDGKPVDMPVKEFLAMLEQLHG